MKKAKIRLRMKRITAKIFARLFNEGEADAVADANTQAAANLADIIGTQNVTGDAISSLVANRQRAETSEGSVQVAATFTLNIQKNISKAMIAPSSPPPPSSSSPLLLLLLLLFPPPPTG